MLFRSLTVKINDKEIEKALLSQFKTQSNISDYFCKLVEQDSEDKLFSDILLASDQQDCVSKKEVFNALNA